MNAPAAATVDITNILQLNFVHGAANVTWLPEALVLQRHPFLPHTTKSNTALSRYTRSFITQCQADVDTTGLNHTPPELLAPMFSHSALPSNL